MPYRRNTAQIVEITSLAPEHQGAVDVLDPRLDLAFTWNEIVGAHLPSAKHCD
jgi:hypothetical protein